jgi:hypothetical protein
VGEDVGELPAIGFESVDGKRAIRKTYNHSFSIVTHVGSIYGHGNR